MYKACIGHVQGVHKVCTRCVQGVYKVCIRCVQGSISGSSFWPYVKRPLKVEDPALLYRSDSSSDSVLCTGRLAMNLAARSKET